MKLLLTYPIILIFGLLIQAQQTFVPDDNFEHFLETHDANMNVVPIGDPNSLGNGIDNDNLVTTAKIAQLTTLLIAGENITDLTGIEDFSALELLNCNNNQITSLNIGNNTSLKILRANTNLLTNLDISQNINLEVVDVNYNQISDLDVSQNQQLLSLSIANNSLNNINATTLTNLEILNCSENNISQIDVSNNIALRVLYVNDNMLTSIDVSQNANLEDLNCGNNQLTNIDVTTNPRLTSLGCYENRLSDLDMSHNPELTVLFANNNQLTSLNMQHGNTSGFMSYFATVQNPDLKCILVDDVAWSMSNWAISIDSWTNLVETEQECMTLAVEEPEKDYLECYPNPVYDKLNLTVSSEGKLTIYNIAGQVVANQRFGSGNNIIDMSQLKQAIYIVKIHFNNNHVIYKKIIKN